MLIYHCKSGARTQLSAKRLAAAAGSCQVYLLGGGIEQWKRAGLPTSDKRSGKHANHSASGRPPGLLNRLAALFR